MSSLKELVTGLFFAFMYFCSAVLKLERCLCDIIIILMVRWHEINYFTNSGHLPYGNLIHMEHMYRNLIN